MTNKFTKSVLEQQAKAQRLRPAIVIPATTPPEPVLPPIEDAPADQQPNEESFEGESNADLATIFDEIKAQFPEQYRDDDDEPQKPARRAKTVAISKNTPDLTDFIVRDTGRTAKNKTFYLDAAVIEAIHRCSLAQKVTDSKLVNDILRKILAV